MRRKEREGRKKEVGAGSDDEDKENEKKERRASRESPSPSEGRRRRELADVFQEVQVWRSVDGAHDDEEEDDAAQEEEDAEEVARYTKRQKEHQVAAADRHGRPDDWDDVILRYENGSAEADVGSKEMAGGAAEEHEFKAKEETEADATLVKKARAPPALGADAEQEQAHAYVTPSTPV
ncbi:hypothetical protein CVT25_002423 [Psilocybe cyanescens]|uniref:Uncharacterized protein n=1 Tax=Psilocybe cyanescens TaxID=93625 RepID=A0A409X0D9_PSICY|nr:hypothetical protein CVT25_002423 [Psilocybe cyanescens]